MAELLELINKFIKLVRHKLMYKNNFYIGNEKLEIEKF